MEPQHEELTLIATRSRAGWTLSVKLPGTREVPGRDCGPDTERLRRPGYPIILARMRVTHPPTTNPRTGNATTVDEWARPINAGIGRYSGWRFDETWEMVPGVWTMQVVYEGRVLVEQSFQVLEP
jgi:hypothetical protein